MLSPEYYFCDRFLAKSDGILGTPDLIRAFDVAQAVRYRAQLIGENHVEPVVGLYRQVYPSCGIADLNLTTAPRRRHPAPSGGPPKFGRVVGVVSQLAPRFAILWRRVGLLKESVDSSVVLSYTKVRTHTRFSRIGTYSRRSSVPVQPLRGCGCGSASPTAATESFCARPGNSTEVQAALHKPCSGVNVPFKNG